MATAISPSPLPLASSPLPTGNYEGAAKTAVGNAQVSNVSVRPFQLNGTMNGVIDKGTMSNQMFLPYVGKGGANAAYSFKTYNEVSTSVKENAKQLADLEKELANKEAALTKFKSTHWASFTFDPLSVSSWTRQLKEERAQKEGEIRALNIQKETLTKTLDAEKKLLSELATTTGGGFSDGRVQETTRLQFSGGRPDTAVNGRFAF